MYRIALMLVAGILAACANSYPAAGSAAEAQMPRPGQIPPVTYNMGDRYWPLSRIDEKLPW